MGGYTIEEKAAKWDERILNDQKRIWAKQDQIIIDEKIMKNINQKSKCIPQWVKTKEDAIKYAEHMSRRMYQYEHLANQYADIASEKSRDTYEEICAYHSKFLLQWDH
jgi:hypothetical protein